MSNEVYTREKLNAIPQEFLVDMYLQLRTSFDIINTQLETVTSQNTELISRISNLQEQVDVLTMNRFGRKSEKNLTVSDAQISFDPETGEFIFNEAEKLYDECPVSEEPLFEEVVVRHRRSKGKRAEDIKDVELIIEPAVTIPDDELDKLFPLGYRRLPDEVYTEVEYHPASFTAHERHYAVYASKGSATHIVRASKNYKDQRLLNNSILSPSLMAGIMDSKYVNHMPLNRIHEDFLRKGINIPRQRLATWCITITDRYLFLLYEKMKDELKAASLLHCDETPFVLRHHGDGSEKQKDYMWVYHTDKQYGSYPLYIYQYPEDGKRNAEAISSFLQGYEGILVTDGYQVYHSLENKNPDMYTVAGCWVHARRKFAELIKAGGKASKGTTAEKAVKLMEEIFAEDKKGKDLPAEERLKHRQDNVKPLVDAYFKWVNSLYNSPALDKSSKTYKALQYSARQETYLRRFLDNAMIPMTNNDAERSIRSFCVGKHSWHVIDTPSGADSSAVLYSIAETAKANNLKTFEYFEYILTELAKHSGEMDGSYLDDLVPWSDKIPDSCRKTK